MQFNRTKPCRLTIPLNDGNLACDLNLFDRENEALTRAPEEMNSLKVEGAFRIAMNIAAASFPALTETEWDLLLTALQSDDPEWNKAFSEIATSSGGAKFLVERIDQEFGPGHLSTKSRDRIEGLTAAQVLPVLFAVDRLYQDQSGHTPDIRSILSRISGRPSEHVYFDGLADG